MTTKYIIVKPSYNPNDPSVEELQQRVLEALSDGYVIVSSAGTGAGELSEVHYVLVKK